METIVGEMVCAGQEVARDSFGLVILDKVREMTREVHSDFCISGLTLRNTDR